MTTTDPLELLASRLDGVRPKANRDGFTARCPAHDDREASLSVDRGKNGGAVLRCFANCTMEQVVAALGLHPRDLYPDNRSNGRVEEKQRTVIKRTRYPIPGPVNPVAIHVRLDYDDGSKQMVWERPGGRSGLGGRPVSSLPLYRSDRLTEATRSAVITEGEKAADALHALLGDDPTLAVLGTVTGASAIPDDTVLAPLVGLDRLTLWPDNDQAGEEHMRRIAGRLVGLGQPAETVHRVHWPEAPEKGDAADVRTVAIALALIDGAAPFPAAPAHGYSVSAGSALPEQPERVEDPWPARAPLPPEMARVPTLPATMVPEPLRAWLVEAAARTCVPLEMVVAPALVAAGAVVGRSVGIRPGRYDRFVTVPNFWGAAIGRPGTMKSDTAGEAVRPLGRLVVKAREAYQTAAAAAVVDIEAIDAQIEAIKKEMQQAARKGEPLDPHKERLALKRDERTKATATERRYVTHDPTIEKLGELLRDNPRGLLLLRDELSGWLQSFDRPGREGDREFFLEAWNGTGSFTTDRIGRGTIHIPALCLSVFGGIQPGKLRPLVMAALDGGAGDDGLLQRLQLLVWPDRLPPWQPPTGWPDPTARERADRVFERLDGLTASDLRAATDEGDIPYLVFTPGAQRLFDQWRDELEHRLRSDELEDSPAFASHLAKYRSLMPALALIFELIALADGEHSATGQVGESALRLAAAWCEFLELHGRKLFAAELAGGMGVAHLLAAKIEAGAISDGDAIRDLYRAGWSGLKTPERLVLGLQVLEEHGWLRIDRAGERRPSQVIRLHPELRPRPPQETDRD